MSSSSLSFAAAAIGSSSHSFSSNSIDHLSIYLFPCKAKPIKSYPKLKISLNVSHFSPLSRSSISCATTEFGSAEFNQEEEPQSDVQETVSDVEEDDNGMPGPKAARRLYVGNLPFSMTSADLSEIFAEAGRVVTVEIVYDRVTDRSRGFSFITMGSVKEAKEAIRLFDGAQIGGRTAKVNFPEVPRGGEREVMGPKIRSSKQGFVDSPHKLYAGNLSWNLTSQALTEVFAEMPGFLSARIIFDRDTGRSRGFGFITFESAEGADSALQAMNGVELEGRPLRLDMAAGKAPAASPPAQVEDELEKAPAASPPPEVEDELENNLENNELVSSVSD